LEVLLAAAVGFGFNDSTTWQHLCCSRHCTCCLRRVLDKLGLYDSVTLTITRFRQAWLLFKFEFNDSTTWQWLLFSAGTDDSTARKFNDSIAQGLECRVACHKKSGKSGLVFGLSTRSILSLSNRHRLAVGVNGFDDSTATASTLQQLHCLAL